jgi:hypothetical protein
LSAYLGTGGSGRKTRALKSASSVLYRQYTKRRPEMDFIRNMQSRDWVIAAIAFVGGAFIF